MLPIHRWSSLILIKLAPSRGAPSSAAVQILRRPPARADMISHQTAGINRMVQKPERYQYSVPRDLARSSYKGMLRCANLAAAYGNVSFISFAARPVLRDDMDRIASIMLMRRRPSFRLSRRDRQQTACSGKRRAKTSKFRSCHTLLHWVTYLELPPSLRKKFQVCSQYWMIRLTLAQTTTSVTRNIYVPGDEARFYTRNYASRAR